ncbi:MAG: sigma-54 dependent transcriptional regulator [Gemmatales bacterium]|nr:sigma-54 dependent transcriptional regulator [Gemmatales bacterium]
MSFPRSPNPPLLPEASVSRTTAERGADPSGKGASLWQQVLETAQFVGDPASAEVLPLCLQVPGGDPSASHFLTTSPRVHELLRLAAVTARTDWPVLIHGETGTGKELLARLLHHWSPRGHHPFIAVNCAALPETLVESELFGCERGSYTGASISRPGYFELADGGTLVLDEISELPQPVQAKLLRVLEEQRIHRLGASRPRAVSVRILALSNRPLDVLARQGLFRVDLLHRLSVQELHLPSLRQRPEDIPLLAEHFLQLARLHFQQPALQWHPSSLVALGNYSWPGNVRQLRNVTWQAALKAYYRGVTIISPQCLPATLAMRDSSSEADKERPHGSELGSAANALMTHELTGSALPTDPGDREPMAQATGPNLRLEALERWAIQEALRQTRGHRRRAAQLLGISLRTLFNKLRRYQLVGTR